LKVLVARLTSDVYMYFYVEWKQKTPPILTHMIQENREVKNRGTGDVVWSN